MITSDNLKPCYSGSRSVYLAVAAGKYLDKKSLQTIVSTIKHDFVGEYGAASEALESPKFRGGNYESYWRGSVWAPDQILLNRSLKSLGFPELTEEI